MKIPGYSPIFLGGGAERRGSWAYPGTFRFFRGFSRLSQSSTVFHGFPGVFFQVFPRHAWVGLECQARRGVPRPRLRNCHINFYLITLWGWIFKVYAKNLHKSVTAGIRPRRHVIICPEQPCSIWNHQEISLLISEILPTAAPISEVIFSAFRSFYPDIRASGEFILLTSRIQSFKRRFTG
jgi:hypothetical protein